MSVPEVEADTIEQTAAAGHALLAQLADMDPAHTTPALRRAAPR